MGLCLWLQYWFRMCVALDMEKKEGLCTEIWYNKN
jgi:hypothetical protein